MRWAWWMWIVVAAAGALLVSAGGCKTVMAEIVIDAKPATVWRVLADAQGFELWNPVHVRIEGAFVEGEDIKIHLKDGEGKVSVFDSTVRRLDPERELSQGGGFPGVLTFSHSFRLESVDGKTRVIQCEKLRGAGVLFIDFDWVEPAYNAVNAALKRRAEELERNAR